MPCFRGLSWTTMSMAGIKSMKHMSPLSPANLGFFQKYLAKKRWSDENEPRGKKTNERREIGTNLPDLFRTRFQ